jgi:hypothetical protein
MEHPFLPEPKINYRQLQIYREHPSLVSERNLEQLQKWQEKGNCARKYQWNKKRYYCSRNEYVKDKERAVWQMSPYTELLSEKETFQTRSVTH